MESVDIQSGGLKEKKEGNLLRQASCKVEIKEKQSTLISEVLILCKWRRVGVAFLLPKGGDVARIECKVRLCLCGLWAQRETRRVRGGGCPHPVGGERGSWTSKRFSLHRWAPASLCRKAAHKISLRLFFPLRVSLYFHFNFSIF